MNRIEIKALHITQNAISSIDLWNDISELCRIPLRLDTAVNIEELKEIDFSIYEFIIFEEMEIKFRELLSSEEWFKILGLIRSKTIFVSRSILLRKHGFNTVIESRLLDKLSEVTTNK